MPSCAFSRKLRCSLRCSSGSSSCKRAPAVADQADLDRIAQADAHRDRDRSERPAPGPASGRNSIYGKRRADHEQACRNLPSPPAKAGCRAVRCRRWCRGCRRARAALPSSALMMGAPSRSAICSSSSRGVQRAPAGQDRDLVARRSGCRRPCADRPSAGRPRARANDVRGMMRDVALRARSVGTPCSCISTGKVMCATPR